MMPFMFLFIPVSILNGTLLHIHALLLTKVLWALVKCSELHRDKGAIWDADSVMSRSDLDLPQSIPINANSAENDQGI